ncbi:FAD-dependent oxidoreductase [Gimibacter soli]|uniref:FAD-dependent oxidoreductase n=1 Tax=Gimibacter soli TaxID=3024400 RepID=A0AAE9XNE5_9PROT|nr:FAD-dependent oxidoreductase [Gimibacter soli]WCL53351.1 FAD-dependent oxidoreductase [Gimibacter soli]
MSSICQRRIAVVGTGISGLSAAWLLHRDHDVTVFEKNDYVGGHSHTVDIDVDGQPVAVDTGFIVYNPVNYPNLTALFDQLSVPTHPTVMSFAASVDDGDFEYSGGDGFGLLAQPINLLRPRFWSMVSGILRFYRNAPALTARAEETGCTLGELLAEAGYRGAFIDDHLAPMAGAIWSSDCRSALEMPAAPFLRFFRNHGLVQLTDRPGWRSVEGGSREYVERLTADFRSKIRLSCGVASLTREKGQIRVSGTDGSSELFDDVVLACHSDEARALAASIQSVAAKPLSAMRYSENEVILHGDTGLMPKRRAAWSAWNFLARSGTASAAPCVTYWMNALQRLGTDTPVLVTLNPDRPINEAEVHGRYTYAHPVFDKAALDARAELWALQGRGGLWFAGAYLGDGFHEDGIQAGLAVAEMIGPRLRPWVRPNQNARIGLPDIITAKRHSPEPLPEPV